MQYLLKISIENTPLWRLIAVDGEADISHIAGLISIAFDYMPANHSFEIAGHQYHAGFGGDARNVEELRVFNELKLKEGDEFFFKSEYCPALRHRVIVMKAEEKLYCLIPSCLVGAGKIPASELNEEAISAYYDKEDTPSLDLREVTNRLRAFGSQRKDLKNTIAKAAAIPFDIK